MSSKGYPKNLGEALSTYTATLRTVIRDEDGGFRLGNAHDTAVRFAHKILNGQTEEQENNRFNKCIAILENWKKDEGCKYIREPLSRRFAFLSLLIEDNRYNRPLTESERLEKIADLNPWQCHPNATTPIGLFEAIHSERYKPLTDYIAGNEWNEYLHMLATLIIYSDGIGDSTQTSDCIRSAMHLMEIQQAVNKAHLELYQERFKQSDPDLRAAFNRRKNKKAKAVITKSNTIQKILEAREKCIENGKAFNNITIATTYKEMFGEKISEATVSRRMRAQGFVRYKK